MSRIHLRELRGRLIAHARAYSPPVLLVMVLVKLFEHRLLSWANEIIDAQSMKAYPIITRSVVWWVGNPVGITWILVGTFVAVVFVRAAVTPSKTIGSATKADQARFTTSSIEKGMRVRVLDRRHLNQDLAPGWLPDMDQFCGRAFVVVEVTTPGWVSLAGVPHYFNQAWIRIE